MARIVDEGKIERIRQSAIDLIVHNGYGGASISAIAHRAGVAEGYLYRFYSSKQELVTNLLYTKIDAIICRFQQVLDRTSDVKEVIQALVADFFEMAFAFPEEIKFIHVLMHDYSFQVSVRQRQTIKELLERSLHYGRLSSDFRHAITLEEAYGMMVVYPIEYINFRFKGFFGKESLEESDMNRVTEFIINALK